MDGGAYAACSGPTSHSLARLAQGAHTFAVRATDAAGNTDPSPATRAFTVLSPDCANQQAAVAAAHKAWVKASKKLTTATKALKTAKKSGKAAKVATAKKNLTRAKKAASKAKHALTAATSTLETCRD